MTISEMHLLFKLSLDKVGNNALPYFEPEAVDMIINYAIKAVVKQKISGNNVLRQGAEETTKRKSDLQSLLSNYEVASNLFISNSSNKPFGVFVPMVSDIFYLLDEEVEIKSTLCDSTKRVNVLPIRNDQYNTLILDPFNRPDKNKILKLEYGKIGIGPTLHIELISSDGIEINKYYLRYYKTPITVNYGLNISCDLPDIIHEEIIDFAVSWTLENIESPRFQSQIANTNRNE